VIANEAKRMGFVERERTSTGALADREVFATRVWFSSAQAMLFFKKTDCIQFEGIQTPAP
jgi:hypothetical protein